MKYEVLAYNIVNRIQNNPNLNIKYYVYNELEKYINPFNIADWNETIDLIAGKLKYGLNYTPGSIVVLCESQSSEKFIDLVLSLKRQ